MAVSFWNTSTVVDTVNTTGDQHLEAITALADGGDRRGGQGNRMND